MEFNKNLMHHMGKSHLNQSIPTHIPTNIVLLTVHHQYRAKHSDFHRNQNNKLLFTSIFDISTHNSSNKTQVL